MKMPAERQRAFSIQVPDKSNRILEYIKSNPMLQQEYEDSQRPRGVNRYNILDTLDSQSGIGDELFKGNLKGKFKK